jgi:Imelysin
LLPEAVRVERGTARVGRMVAAAGLGAVLLLAGCGNDDGAGVRSEGSASGSGTGSGTGSGSGLANQDLSGTTSDRQVLEAVADYKAWVVAEVDALVADTARFTDAVRAGDLAEARKQFAPSRVRWERIEPIAGLVEEIDGKVDARVDDFEGVTDPQFTGWHQPADVSPQHEPHSGLTPPLDASSTTTFLSHSQPGVATLVASNRRSARRSLAEASPHTLGAGQSPAWPEGRRIALYDLVGRRGCEDLCSHPGRALAAAACRPLRR